MMSEREHGPRHPGDAAATARDDRHNGERPDMQTIYAAQLETAVKIAAVVLLATFTLYVCGIVPSVVPLDELPNCWSSSSQAFLRTTGLEVGRNWIFRLHSGECLSCLGLACLAIVTIVCYLRVLPCAITNHDRIYTGIIAAEVLVLVLGAADVLAVAQ
jgi:hypothetical protein